MRSEIDRSSELAAVSSSRCDESVCIPVPLTLKNNLKKLAARDCSPFAATARLLLARSVERELALEVR